MSGSCRRHPSILFIKLGSSVTANMQWLESWELETLESLSTFETGTHLLGSTERCFKLQNNFRFTQTYWSHEKAEKVSRLVWWENQLSYLLATPPPILSFVQNRRRSMSHLSWEDQHTSALGMSWLVFSKSQTVQGCYLIPNRDRTFVRRPWTYFTFSGGKHKPPSKRRHPKSKALWGLLTLSGIFPVSSERARDAGRNWNHWWIRWVPSTKWSSTAVPRAEEPNQAVLVLKSCWGHELCTICLKGDLMLSSAGAAGMGQDRLPQWSESLLSNISGLTRSHVQLLLKALEALQPLNLGKR